MEKLPDLHSSNWPHFPKESNSNRCEEAKKKPVYSPEEKEKKQAVLEKIFCH